MQEEFLIELEDVAWVTKSRDGKMKLHQASSETGTGAASGALWGFVFGLLFLVPIFQDGGGSSNGRARWTLRPLRHRSQVDQRGGKRDCPWWLRALCHGPQHESRAGVAGDGEFGGTVLKTNLTARQQQALEGALSGCVIAYRRLSRSASRPP